MSADFDVQNDLRRQLAQFTRSETRYVHVTNQLQYTEGVQFLVENAGAQWLIDKIASLQPVALRDSGLAVFQLWELAVKGDRSAALTCSRATDDAVFRERIAFTDCPLGYVRLYVQGGVLMLPSEH